MTFIGLLAHNVWRRRLRAVVTAIAVAIGVTAVLALGVLTTSLRATAVSVLKIGRADFSISQKGASDVLYSTISREERRSWRRKFGPKRPTPLMCGSCPALGTNASGSAA